MMLGILASAISRVATEEPGALWTPLNMATVPQIYLDAQDSVVTDEAGFASAISNLGAMGVDGDFSQVAVDRRPAIVADGLNGKRVLSFDGAGDVLTASALAARELFRNTAAAWAFVVYKKRELDSAPKARYLIYAPKNDGAVRFGVLAGDSATGRANKPYMFARRLDSDDAASLLSPNAVQGSYCLSVASVNFSTRAGILRENGAQVANNSALTAAAGNTSDTASGTVPIAVGAYYSGSLASDVDVAAIVLGNVQPSGEEFEKLEGWAAHKYGLTANLPANHPYKATAPTV